MNTAPAPILDPETMLVQWYPWIRKLSQRFLKYATPFGANGIDAEDIAQEAALKAVRSFHGFDPKRGTFPTWLKWQVRAVVSKIRSKASAKKRAIVTVSFTDDADGRDRLAQIPDYRGHAHQLDD